MQAGGARSIETEPAEQNHARDRVGCLSQAGPGKVVVYKSLSSKAREQPLHDSLFQVQVDYVFVHGARVFEDDRADGRCATPLPPLLIPFAGSSKSIQRVSPGRVGAISLIQRRKGKSRGAGL